MELLVRAQILHGVVIILPYAILRFSGISVDTALAGALSTGAATMFFLTVTTSGDVHQWLPVSWFASTAALAAAAATLLSEGMFTASVAAVFALLSLLIGVSMAGKFGSSGLRVSIGLTVQLAVFYSALVYLVG